MNHLLKYYSKKYFLIENKCKSYFNKQLEKELLIAKMKYVKKYGMDLTEKELQEIKKNIVMKKGLFMFSIVVVGVFLLVS